jgi:hypothetical protein
MAITLYNASVPVFVKMLTNLSGMLDKAVAQAEAKKFDQAFLLADRVYPDMFTFTKQVQIAADFAKNSTARLAGVEPPRFEDTETSFAELKARIARTVEYLGSFKPEQIDGREDADIRFTIAKRDMHYKGLPFLLDWALPNFYFHVTTAYALLRGNGIDVGKKDFLG